MPFDGTVPHIKKQYSGSWALRVWLLLCKAGRYAIHLVSLLGRHSHADMPSVSPALLLRNARALISPRERWVRGSYRVSGGRHCAVGALHAMARQLNAQSSLPSALALLHQVARRRGFKSIEKMNDASTHAQVLESFDIAIEMADALCTA